jgi:hypothetical protein
VVRHRARSRRTVVLGPDDRARQRLPLQHRQRRRRPRSAALRRQRVRHLRQGQPHRGSDNAPPGISITSPADGATFQQGQDVKAAFSCADDANGTGIERCTGTVASGASIETGTPGSKTFSVEAVDRAGNTATALRTYSVAQPPPPPPVALKRIFVTLSSNFPSIGKTIRFTRLVVKNAPRGSTVTATCKTKQGRRCRGIKKFTKRNARGTVKLKRFLRKTLRAGTVIEVRVTKPGTIGAVKRLTVRNGKNPTITTRCLPPGAKKPSRC